MPDPSALTVARAALPPPLPGKVRPLRDDDVKLFLLDLEHRHGGPDHWTSRRFDHLHRRNHGGLVFVDRDRSVVGHLTYVTSSRTVLVTRLLVRPDRRRRGVAYALLGRLFDMAAQRPVFVRLGERQVDLQVFFRGWGVADRGAYLAEPSVRDGDRDVILRLVRQPL